MGESVAAKFLKALWPGGLPEHGHLVIAVKRGDRGMAAEFFDDVDAAAKRAVVAGQKHDVYVGMAAQPKLSHGRGTTETALAIHALWLDLDFDKGFRNMEGVRKFLNALPYPPSLIVVSGGGAHVYWLLKEALEISDQDRSAAAIELGWLQYCRSIAKIEMKAELDAIADLARVLRVPGTKNFKREQVTEVLLVDFYPERRYDPSDFEQWRAAGRSSNSTATFEFSLHANAQPPFRKWAALQTNMPEIVAIFDHKSKMPVDNSLSGYDLSLATRLDMLDWSSQEIVDTLVAHRAQWSKEITDPGTLKDPLHIKDPGYYDRVLRKAKSANDRGRMTAHVAAQAEEVNEELDVLGGSKPEPSLRIRWMRSVSDVLGIEVVDVWSFDPIESPWNVRVMVSEEGRDIKVSSPNKLLQWETWKSMVMACQASVENLPPKMPPPFYALMCRVGKMLRIASQDEGVRVVDDLIEYLWEAASEAPSFDATDLHSKRPFRKIDGGPKGIDTWGQPEECFFTRIDEMAFDVKMGRVPRLPNLKHALLELGFVSRTVAFEGTSRNYMCVPMARLSALRRGPADSPENGSSDGLGSASGDGMGGGLVS